MKLRKISVLITIGAIISTLLTGCGGTDPKTVLNVYNVGDYIDEDLIKVFEEKTGIDVQYETYDTNEMMYQKVKSDIIFLYIFITYHSLL